MSNKHTDYSFMKSGFSLTKEKKSKDSSNDQLDNIMSMLTMFSSNAVVNAGRYVELCNRNGITEQDMKNGLIYEVFEFTKRPNFKEEMENIKEEIKNESDDEEEEEEEEEEENNNKEINENLIIKDEDIMSFSRIENVNDLESEDKEFVIKYHNYIDNWEDWKPTNIIENLMKKSINKINI